MAEVRKMRSSRQVLAREKALAGLAAGESNRAAAKRAGVSEAAIRDWLKEPTFASALEELLAAGVLSAERRLRGAGPALAERLVKVALGKAQASPASVGALRDALTRLGVGKTHRIEVYGELALASEEEIAEAIRQWAAQNPGKGGQE